MSPIQRSRPALSVFAAVLGVALCAAVAVNAEDEGPAAAQVRAAEEQAPTRASGPPRLRSTAGDAPPAARRSGSVTAHEAVGGDPIGRVRPGSDGPTWSRAVAGDLAMELARGTRAESAHLATIGARADDPRLALLRLAVWSRERRPTGVRSASLAWASERR